MVKKNGIPEEQSTLKTLGILKLYYFNYNHCSDLFLFEDKTGARGTLWTIFLWMMGGLGVKKVDNHWFKDLIKYEHYDNDNNNINNLPFVMMALVAAGTLNFKSKRN